MSDVKNSFPLWSTKERQAFLVRLWFEVGDRCLHGHYLCDNPSHYIYVTYKLTYISKQVQRRTIDRFGKVITVDTMEITPSYVPVFKLSKLYDYLSDKVISVWKDNDRIQRRIDDDEWKRIIHHVPSRNKNRIEFNADFYFDNQPLFYLVGLSLDVLTLKPIAKVRLASSNSSLFVNLPSGLFNTVSKNKKRKALRYGKGLTPRLDTQINAICTKAVKSYLG